MKKALPEPILALAKQMPTASAENFANRVVVRISRWVTAASPLIVRPVNYVRIVFVNLRPENNATPMLTVPVKKNPDAIL